MIQIEIAKKTGISQSQVSKILSGKPIGKDTAKKLATVTDYKWNEIIGMNSEEIKNCLKISLSKIDKCD